MTTIKAFIKRHLVLTYFALTFAISMGGILIAVGREGMPIDRYSLIPILSLFAGPSAAGLLLTGIFDGKKGLCDFGSRLFRWRVSARWYAVAILITPLVVTPILLALSLFSPDFLPAIITTDDKVALLLLGIVAGLVGGFLEELGWTGFAVPRLRLRYNILTTGLIVGLLWGAWHVPITFAASVSPSGAISLPLFLPPLFFYVAVLPVFRVFMVWVYDRTESLLVAILMHWSLAASTFTILLPPAIGRPLITYYLILAAVLWILVAAVVLANREQLSQEPLQRRVA